MLKERVLFTNQLNNIYKASIYHIDNIDEKNILEDLFKKDDIFIYDGLYDQLKELIKCKNPSVKLKDSDYEELIAKHLGGRSLDEYGVWVHYPWSSRLVHILDEKEFVEVRTNRNKYKITNSEQALLNTKSIGVIGLSVGQSIALTMAMERVCGELRLADFDTAELSNLNRIRTGVHNLGLMKTVIAAREIAEIDPFLKVKIFNDGLTESNIDDFFTGDKNLDMLVEVCDGLNIKIVSRFKARQLGIPVVMDTNDRGMLDVERFDLEPDRPILHGLAGDLDPDKIKNLTNEEKIPYILKMVGTDTLSMRLKASMMEVEQTINTWPQLASSVVLGGALVTDVARRIFLDQYHDSGRYYIDLDDLIKDKNERKAVADHSEYDGPRELSKDELLEIADSYVSANNDIKLSAAEIKEIVDAAIQAPSGGNVQPWKFVYHNNILFVFHDEHYSYSLLDYNNLGSYVALGAAIENISIKSNTLGLDTLINYFPANGTKKLVAAISFSRSGTGKKNKILEEGIYSRLTNRNAGAPQPIEESIYKKLGDSIAAYDNAKLHLVTDRAVMDKVGELLATTEMLRIIHARGHYDTFTKELRWTPEENEEKRDGIDVRTMGVSAAEVAALRIAEDENAIAFLRNLNGGHAFKKMVRKNVGSASALGIITMPEYSELDFLKGGRAMQRVWIEANSMGVSFQPIAQLVFFLARMKFGNGDGLDDYYKRCFDELGTGLYNLLPDLQNKQIVFIFRLSIADQPAVKSLRKNIDSVFFSA